MCGPAGFFWHPGTAPPPRRPPRAARVQDKKGTTRSSSRRRVRRPSSHWRPAPHWRAGGHMALPAPAALGRCGRRGDEGAPDAEGGRGVYKHALYDYVYGAPPARRAGLRRSPAPRERGRGACRAAGTRARHALRPRSRGGRRRVTPRRIACEGRASGARGRGRGARCNAAGWKGGEAGENEGKGGKLINVAAKNNTREHFRADSSGVRAVGLQGGDIAKTTVSWGGGGGGGRDAAWKRIAAVCRGSLRLSHFSHAHHMSGCRGLGMEYRRRFLCLSFLLAPPGGPVWGDENMRSAACRCSSCTVRHGRAM